MALRRIYAQIVGLQQKLIFKTALENQGRDVSPLDRATDEYGCAESVTELLRLVFPTFPVITGTWTLNQYLSSDRKWAPTDSPKAGDVIISPTGEGGARKIGHVGIVGEHNTVMSNSSYTGLWTTNYTIDTWKTKYKTFPVYYYRYVG